MSTKSIGDKGEKEVCAKCLCPNCRSTLVLLPPGFPLNDIQCSRCVFRAQIKTTSSRPKASVQGAGWDIFEKVLKAGYLAPSLIVNSRWFEKDGYHQEIRFYPFIANDNIEMYQLSDKAIRKGYRMFRYIKLDTTPWITLYTEFDPNRSASTEVLIPDEEVGIG